MKQSAGNCHGVKRVRMSREAKSGLIEQAAKNHSNPRIIHVGLIRKKNGGKRRIDLAIKKAKGRAKRENGRADAGTNHGRIGNARLRSKSSNSFIKSYALAPVSGLVLVCRCHHLRVFTENLNRNTEYIS